MWETNVDDYYYYSLGLHILQVSVTSCKFMRECCVFNMLLFLCVSVCLCGCLLILCGPTNLWANNLLITRFSKDYSGGKLRGKIRTKIRLKSGHIREVTAKA